MVAEVVVVVQEGQEELVATVAQVEWAAIRVNTDLVMADVVELAGPAAVAVTEVVVLGVQVPESCLWAVLL